MKGSASVSELSVLVLELEALAYEMQLRDRAVARFDFAPAHNSNNSRGAPLVPPAVYIVPFFLLAFALNVVVLHFWPGTTAHVVAGKSSLLARARLLRKSPPVQLPPLAVAPPLPPRMMVMTMMTRTRVMMTRTSAPMGGLMVRVLAETTWQMMMMPKKPRSKGQLCYGGSALTVVTGAG